MTLKLGKMFDWKVDSIIEAKNADEAFIHAYKEFNCIITQTVHFDNFSHKVKMARLEQVETTYADKVKISLEKAKYQLLTEFFKNTPNYYDIGVDGYERADLQEPPLPLPENILTTDSRAGYITPEGIFFGCCLEGHSELCFDLIKLGLIPQDTPQHLIYAYPDDMGWLKVSDLAILKFEYDFFNNIPTVQQEEIVQQALLRFDKKSFKLNDNTGVTKLRQNE